LFDQILWVYYCPVGSDGVPGSDPFTAKPAGIDPPNVCTQTPNWLQKSLGINFSRENAEQSGAKRSKAERAEQPASFQKSLTSTDSNRLFGGLKIYLTTMITIVLFNFTANYFLSEEKV
jgi:hypothetical protein